MGVSTTKRSVLSIFLIALSFEGAFLPRHLQNLQDTHQTEPTPADLSRQFKYEQTVPDLSSRFEDDQDTFVVLEKAIFLHLGKAGGGSVRKRMVQWRLRFRECHPLPCTKLLRGLNLLVAVRDPVDRFVSAFNWRALVVCRLANETRSPAQRDAVDSPHLYCKPNLKHPDETRSLLETYKSNVSLLAEALCDSGLTGEQARAASKTILHAKSSLTDWIPSDLVEHGNLAAIVLEPGFDFIQQIDSGLKWVASEALGEENAAWLSNNMLNTSVGKEWLHSYEVNDYRPPPLSPLGTCCLAQHLVEDYKLLQKLQEVACRESDSCREALQSIHDRRKRLLDEVDCGVFA